MGDGYKKKNLLGCSGDVFLRGNINRLGLHFSSRSNLSQVNKKKPNVVFWMSSFTVGWRALTERSWIRGKTLDWMTTVSLSSCQLPWVALIQLRGLVKRCRLAGEDCVSATLVHVRRKCAFKDRQRQTGREERLPIKQHRARWRGKKKSSARIKKNSRQKRKAAVQRQA